MTDAEVKADAEAKADADCARGLADLTARIAYTPEWVESGQDGKRFILPERASLKGMHAHLSQAMERERARRTR